MTVSVTAALIFAGCTGRTGGADAESADSDSIALAPAVDTLLVVTMPDNALWGHMGEDTGMSVMEFITDNGDTLELSKTDEMTGKEAVILGDMNNFTDRWCLTVTPDSSTIVKAVNVTQLQLTWSEAEPKD